MNTKEFGKFLNVGIIVTLILIIGIFGFWGNNHKQKRDVAENLTETLNDTLEVYQGKDGENRARISQFIANDAKTFLRLKSTEKDVIWLQKQVEKYKKEIKDKGSVSVSEIQGNYATTVPTKVSYPMIPIKDTASGKTIKVADITSPIYIANSGDKFGEWANISSIATKDSTKYTLLTKDRITLVLGVEKTGFFGMGKGKPFADITNENPFSTTKSLRSFEVNNPYKRLVLGIGGTYGGTYLNNQVGLGFTIGLTLNYSLIKF